MSGVRITVRDEDVLGALSRLSAAAGNVQGALKNVGESLRQSTIDRIVAGVTPSGTPFAPLNPGYAKTKKGPGILRGATGDLASIVYQLGAGGESVSIGTNVVYGAIHQFGGTIRPRTADALAFSLGGATVMVESVTIPARPYLGISDADQSEILAIFADFFEMAAGGTAPG